MHWTTNGTCFSAHPWFWRQAARLLGLLVLGSMASPSWAIVSSTNDPNNIFNGVNINQLVGADQFYNNGYWGSNAVIANIEAGFVWNGAETLGAVNTFITDPSTGDISTGSNGQTILQYDWHATMVGQVLAGQSPIGWGYGWSITSGGQTANLAFWYGMAPSAQLWSGAIATGWNPDPGVSDDYSGSFNITALSLVYAYKTAMQTGVVQSNGTVRKADVINSSWGYTDNTGTAVETMIIDALTYTNHQTVVVAAGNHDSGTAQVTGPASGFNSIAVGAMTGDMTNPPYSTLAAFSNTGLNDYYDPNTGTVIPQVRAGVDIVAPGDNLTVAYYGGLTGGHVSGVDQSGGAGYYYASGMGGTSFAAPIVAGGAALLVDMGYDRFSGDTSSTGQVLAVDGRIIKVVLLNSADKTAGWNNAQTMVNGVVRTTQGLDSAVGAGMLDLARAYTQYGGGTCDVPGLGGGNVQTVGWDYGSVARGAANNYYITQNVAAGSRLTATLDWFVNTSYDGSQLSAADPDNVSASWVQFSNLDLQVWRVVGGVPTVEVADCDSLYNNIDQLYFAVPQTGEYMIRVLRLDDYYNFSGITTDSTDYGLAWSVPEPGTIVLLLAGAGAAAVVLWRRRRARR